MYQRIYDYSLFISLSTDKIFTLLSKDKTIMLDKNSGDTIYLVNKMFLHQPEQVFSLGWNNEMILTYVPQLWLMELYNEDPKLFT